MQSKIVKCVDCGEEYPRKELNRRFRCRDCAWGACVAAMAQLANKKGPYYDRWVESMSKVPENIEAQAEKMKQRYIEGLKWRAILISGEEVKHE